MICAKCKSVWYCGKQHQKEDWPFHKQICRALTEVAKLKEENEENEASQEAFHAETRWLKRKLELVLERPLTPNEYDIILYRSHCKVCFREKDLTQCETCYIVSFCSKHQNEESKKDHVETCRLFRLAGMCQKLQLKENFPFFVAPNPGKKKYNRIDFEKLRDIENERILGLKY